MTPELWQRLKPLYEAAMETPAQKRARFVADACRGDSEARRELETLLARGEVGTDSLDRPFINFKDFWSPAQRQFQDGELIDGRFLIVRLLGSGGMGNVYEAEDRELGRIALKTIRPELAEKTAVLARFREEVLLARQMGGPNVCRIHELFVVPHRPGEKVAFITMELLDGVTLEARLAAEGYLPLRSADSIARQLCAALTSIHQAHVIHRDLKPGNIMLVPHDGAERAVVMDFGLAHAVSAHPATDSTTVAPPGVVMGTPDYMAPEQFEGSEAGPQTDIYALGVVLYEMLTGKQPFAASSIFGAAVRRGRPPKHPSSIRKEIPVVWDGVIARCLQYEPERRYRSASDVVAALNQKPLTLWRFRNGYRIAIPRRAAFAAVTVVLAVFAITGGFWLRARSYHQPPPEAQRWYQMGVAALRENTGNYPPTVGII